MPARCVAVLLVIQLVSPSGVFGREKKDKELPPYEFYSTAFTMGEATIPECAPLRPKPHPGFDEVGMEDPNGSWHALSVPQETWERLRKFVSMEECLGTVDTYKGRYSKEDVENLMKGRLAAGMPFEFALMVLGPTELPPSYVSMLNPASGKAEEFRSYTWIKTPDSLGLGIFFSALGIMSFTAAATTNNLNAMSRYLNVGAGATVVELLVWESAFSKARAVSVQVSSNDTITLVAAQ